jgi:hypothetical protein
MESWRLKKLRSVMPTLSLVLLTGLLMLMLPQLGAWVLNKIRGSNLPHHSQFETAYQGVRSLDEKGYASILGSATHYGIRQLDYDKWRQLNGKPVKDLSEITEEEVKAVYWMHWETGNCEQFPLPLDLVCLDSVASFGAQSSQSFWVNLPTEPKQAAMEVVSRREAARRRAMRPPITPSKQVAIREGLRRDRALADIVAATLSPQPPAQPPVPYAAPPSQQPFTSPPAQQGQLSAEQIYAQVKPATVEVWNTTQPGIASTAAGVILTADGLVLTNHHVIERNLSPTVKLADGRKFTATVSSIDHTLDLALLQLNQASDLPTAPLSSDTTQVKVGDTVYAIGSPRGESWAFSTSQVIALNSTCANGTSPLRCIRTPGGFLYPGNSGGPLIASSGEVIGINRAVQQSTGEGVSIPIETVQEFLNQRMGLPQQQPPQSLPKRSSWPRRWL